MFFCKTTLILLILDLLTFNLFSQEFDISNNVKFDGVKQIAFTVGGREQRIRFFITNGSNADIFLRKSAQYNKLYYDPLSLQNQFISYYAAVGVPPIDAGMALFSENSNKNSLIVNFPLISCAVRVVELIKTIGDRNKDVFHDYKIDEINIFLKPTNSSDSKDYKMNLGTVASKPIDPSLNVQVPILMPSGNCRLPEESAIETALKATACKQLKKYCSELSGR